MPSITQTIRSYTGGLSNQPDERKFPGQLKDIKNAFPDITHGLMKRPGGRMIKSLSDDSTAAFNSVENGKWFHYYRDDVEQYIGQITRTGDIKMWQASDGAPCTVSKIGTSTEQAALTTYLTHAADSDMQTLTLNDFTYITNRTKVAAFTSDTTPDQESHAYIELKKIAYSQQYAVNVFDDTTTQSVFNSLRVSVYREYDSANQCDSNGAMLSSGTLPEGGTRCDASANDDRDSYCPNVETKIFSINDGDTGETSQANGASWSIDVKDVGNNDVSTLTGANARNPRNLYLRIATIGQAMPEGNSNAPDYYCRYTTTHDLLYGGNDWKKGDYFYVWMKNAKYKIVIEEDSEAVVQANLALARPTPTPFDTETVITAESVIGDVRAACLCLDDITLANNNLTGSGYLSAPPVVFTHAYGSGAKATASISSGVITGITIDAHGEYYNSAPTIQFGYSWEAGKAYSTGDQVINDSNKLYTCVTAGTSAGSGGPTGTGSGITDNTAAWDYAGAGGVATARVMYAKQIGNGLYLKRPSGKAFNVSTTVSELLFPITTKVNDVGDLPKQCRHGYRVKVANSAADEDDYYVQFYGNGDKDGEGVWEECAKPGVKDTFDKTLMPIQLVRTSLKNFQIKHVEWDKREVGDEITNPDPSFIGNKINKLVFFRNRLCMFADENVIMSRPGDFFNFWAKTAITYSAEDSIDLSCSSEFPAIIYDGIQVNAGLLMFTPNQQFLLTTDSDVLSPNTAKINNLASYNFNIKTSPLIMGTTVGFLDNAGQKTRFFEMTRIAREGEPDVIEQSKGVDKMFPKNIDMIANSRENTVILFCEKNSSWIYGYRYFNASDKRLLNSWFKWYINGEIMHHAMMDDAYYVVVRTTNSAGVKKDVLQKFALRLDAASDFITDDQGTTITEDDIDYRIHLDNSTTVEASALTYDSTNKRTTFALPAGFNSTTAQLAAIVKTSGSSQGWYSGTASVKQVETISVTAGGSGYTDPPAVTITGTTGTGATATAVLTGNAVSSIKVDNPGTNYWNGATVTIAAPPSGTTATATATVNNNVVLDKKWDTDIVLGYLFDMELTFPTIYYGREAGDSWHSNLNGSLVVHRVKLSLGPSGVYETTLIRPGKPDYTELFESATADQYNPDRVAIDEEQKATIPVYEKNTNLKLKLKSTHSSPATLYSMTWEGDWTDKYYNRV